jgi:hypothetical protein
MELPNVTQNYWKERNGVLKVGLALNECGYIFRETPNADIGIDGQIEYVNQMGQASGKVVAAQIKSGDSYLLDKGNHFVFYPSEKHRNYWSLFPLPVILFVHYPKEDRIYFIDVKYQLNIPKREGNYISIPKTAVLNSENAKQIFETTGNFEMPYLVVDELFRLMASTCCKNPTFKMSYLDLFTQGLTNICRHVYFNMDLAMVIADYNNDSEFGMGLGSYEYEFLDNYAKFIISQNLANIDYSDYLLDWKERELVPSFIAPLTYRGRELLEYIKGIEAKYQDELPATTLVRERSIAMQFITPDDFARLEMGKRIRSILNSQKSTH